MARKKSNTQNDTKARRTPWRNGHLEKLSPIASKQLNILLKSILSVDSVVQC